mmetsp:Transcript_7868/g.11680  ORF Transcript_7868/g.11680 Transcript_7868/m.11680 type:complete len:117 (-) Transcript_7868:675-1025(-)
MMMMMMMMKYIHQKTLKLGSVILHITPMHIRELFVCYLYVDENEDHLNPISHHASESTNTKTNTDMNMNMNIHNSSAANNETLPTVLMWMIMIILLWEIHIVTHKHASAITLGARR